MADLKQKQKFENSWKEIIQMTNNESPEKLARIAKSEVQAIFEEVAKERIEIARKEFKTKLTGLLQAKLELDKTIDKGRKELQQKEEKEYEKLNGELNNTMQLLANVKKEAETLTEVAGGNFDSTQTDETVA